jgi:hypothetical protein
VLRPFPRRNKHICGMGSGRRRALAASKAGNSGFDLRERIQSAVARPRIAIRHTVERRPVLRPASVSPSMSDRARVRVPLPRANRRAD